MTLNTLFIINYLLIHFYNQNQSLDTFHEQENTDAEKFKNEVINVFTQKEFDSYSKSEISTNHTFLAPHGYFSNLENFAHKAAAHYSLLKFDIDDEFSAKIDTLRVNHASSECFTYFLQLFLGKIPLQGCLFFLPIQSYLSLFS